jgi:DnaJ-class molecular chaperone
MTVCRTCSGRGSVKCPSCNGKGTRYESSGLMGGTTVRCRACGGSGVVKCGVCQGKGQIK